MGDWHRIADDVAGMRFIPNVRGSRYSNNAIAMREALKDYLMVKLEVLGGNRIMCGGHRN